MSLSTAAARIKREIRVWTLVLQDPRTPPISKWLLGAALVYLASPVDIIPDFIPLLGQLDDLVIVPALFWLALRFIPRKVVMECRLRAQIAS
ncbi:MAG: YkvA family protein [Candidatus Cryosericum sp.]